MAGRVSQTPQSPRLPKQFASTFSKISDGDYLTDVRADRCTVSASVTEYAGIERASLSQVQIPEVNLTGLQCLDVQFVQCDLSNGIWYDPSLHRVEFIGCRMTGLALLQGTFHNVLFRDCNLRWAQLRFGKFAGVCFDRCLLTHADFHGSDLTSVTFDACDLQEAQFHQARLDGTDFRGSKITGLKAGVSELQGAVFEPPQAMELLHLLGIKLQWRSESLE